MECQTWKPVLFSQGVFHANKVPKVPFTFSQPKTLKILLESHNGKCWRFHSAFSFVLSWFFIFIAEIHIVRKPCSLTVRYKNTLSSFPPIVSSSCPLYSSLSPTFTFIMWFCRIVLRRRWSILKVSSTKPFRY